MAKVFETFDEIIEGIELLPRTDAEKDLPLIFFWELIRELVSRQSCEDNSEVLSGYRYYGEVIVKMLTEATDRPILEGVFKRYPRQTFKVYAYLRHWDLNNPMPSWAKLSPNERENVSDNNPAAFPDENEFNLIPGSFAVPSRSVTSEFIFKFNYGSKHAAKSLDNFNPDVFGPAIHHLAARGMISKLWVNWTDYTKEELIQEFKKYLDAHMPVYIGAAGLGRPSIRRWYREIAALRFSRECQMGHLKPEMWLQFVRKFEGEKISSAENLDLCLKNGWNMLKELKPSGFNFRNTKY